MSNKSNKLSVVSINYNSTQKINLLIKSLSKISKYIKEIIIIDNNSKDVEKLISKKNIHLIRNESNLGFAKAANQGIKVSKSNLILLINPDCYLEDNSIIKSIHKITKDKKIGIIGGKIKKDNSNKYQFTANSKPSFLTGIFEFTNLKKLFPNNHFSQKFWIEKTYKLEKPIKVNSLCGAYIILRKKIGKKLNLFDERYFLYLEDIDIGDKVNNAGYKVIFDPESEVTHFGGSSSNSKYNIVLKYWYLSRKKYFQKHLNPFESAILTIVFTLEEKFLWIYHKIKAEPYV